MPLQYKVDVSYEVYGTFWMLILPDNLWTNLGGKAAVPGTLSTLSYRLIFILTELAKENIPQHR